VLVRTGKLREADLACDIHPDAVLESFADMPEWWRAHVAGEVTSRESS
jgi:hypothetical protein